MPDRPFWTHAYDLAREIRQQPKVQEWRRQQFVKIAELQKGTYAERRDKDGNPVAKPPMDGVEAWFEYVVYVTGVSSEITVRCNQTGDTLPLSDPDEEW